jgi:glycopeptide antibiotics resistance protein
MPIPLLFSLFILAICIWSSITHSVFTSNSQKVKTGWRIVCSILSLFSVLIIFDTAIFSRQENIQELYLLPFRLIIMAKDNPELYRSMFMNIIFFVPFGMTFSAVFSEAFSLKKRIIATCVVAFLISITVETVQYTAAIGTAEFDDLTCNTFGALLGTLPLIIQKIYNQNNEK